MISHSRVSAGDPSSSRGAFPSASFGYSAPHADFRDRVYPPSSSDAEPRSLNLPPAGYPTYSEYYHEDEGYYLAPESDDVGGGGGGGGSPAPATSSQIMSPPSRFRRSKARSPRRSRRRRSRRRSGSRRATGASGQRPRNAVAEQARASFWSPSLVREAPSRRTTRRSPRSSPKRRRSRGRHRSGRRGPLPSRRR